MLSQPLKVAENVEAPRALGKLPIDMALNHGTYSSPRCAEVIARYNSNTSFRLFPDVANRDLREALAEDARVDAENIFVANGSGPLLKMCLPLVVEQKIKASFSRMARHLLTKNAYPIITPRLTYSKVPVGALKNGLKVELLPLGPENGFTLSMDVLKARLEQGDGMVYITNPNNPTGNVLITREQLVPLLARFPETTFVIDEAYVQYIPESRHKYMADLVLQYPNLLVMRSFSFAYGLGGARIGYIVAHKKLVQDFDAKMTPHQVGQIASDLAVVSVKDKAHMEFVRRETAEQRALLIEAFKKYQGVEVWESEVNFFLGRLSNGMTGVQLHDALLKRGVRIKTFPNLPGHNFDEYFRITVGLPEEN